MRSPEPDLHLGHGEPGGRGRCFRSWVPNRRRAALPLRRRPTAQDPPRVGSCSCRHPYSRGSRRCPHMPSGTIQDLQSKEVWVSVEMKWPMSWCRPCSRSRYVESTAQRLGDALLSDVVNLRLAYLRRVVQLNDIDARMRSELPMRSVPHGCASRIGDPRLAPRRPLPPRPQVQGSSSIGYAVSLGTPAGSTVPGLPARHRIAASTRVW